MSDSSPHPTTTTTLTGGDGVSLRVLPETALNLSFSLATTSVPPPRDRPYTIAASPLRDSDEFAFSGNPDTSIRGVDSSVALQSALIQGGGTSALQKEPLMPASEVVDSGVIVHVEPLSRSVPIDEECEEEPTEAEPLTTITNTSTKSAHVPPSIPPAAPSMDEGHEVSPVMQAQDPNPEASTPVNTNNKNVSPHTTKQADAPLTHRQRADPPTPASVVASEPQPIFPPPRSAGSIFQSISNANPTEGESASPKAKRLKGWSLVAKELVPSRQHEGSSSKSRRVARHPLYSMVVVGSIVSKSLIETKIDGRPLVFWLRSEERDEQSRRDRIEAEEDIAIQAITVLVDESLAEAQKNVRRLNVRAANVKQRQEEEVQRWKQLRYRLRCEEDEGRVVVFLVEDRAFREIVAEEKGKRVRIVNAARNRRATGSSTGRVPVRLEHDLADHLRKMKIRPQDRSVAGLVPFEEREAVTFSGLSPQRNQHASSPLSHHPNYVHDTNLSSPISPSSAHPSRLPPITLSPIPTSSSRTGTRSATRFQHASTPRTNQAVLCIQRIGRGFMLRRGPVSVSTNPQPNVNDTLEEWEETNAIRRLLSKQRKAAMPNRKEIPTGFRVTTPQYPGSLQMSSSFAPNSTTKSKSSFLSSTVKTMDTSPQVLIYDRKTILDEQAREAKERARRLKQIDAELTKNQMINHQKELKALRELQRIKEECEREKVTLRERRKLAARKAKIAEQQKRFKEESKKLRELDQREIDRVEIHVALRQKHMGETRIEALKRTLVEVPGASRVASMSAQLSVSKAERSATT